MELRTKISEKLSEEPNFRKECELKPNNRVKGAGSQRLGLMASRKKNASSDDVSVPGSEKSTPKRNKSLNSVTGGSDGETVMVVVRMRPFNKKELGEKRGPCIDMDYKMKQVGITQMMDGEAKGAPNVFTFDSIHGEDTVQIDFYNTACRKLVNSVLSGFNGTIFAYGQTGCGKTWTMQVCVHFLLL